MLAIEVTFTLEPNDAVAFQNYWQKSKSGKHPVLLWIIVVPVMVLAAAFQIWTETHHRPRPIRHNDGNVWLALASMLIPLVMFTCFWIVIWKFVKKGGLSNPEHIPGFLHQRTVRISPEGYCDKTTNLELSQRWQGVEDIVDDTAHIYIFTSKDVAHVVPKRAFSTPTEAQAFYEQAISYWRTARPETLRAPLPEPDGQT